MEGRLMAAFGGSVKFCEFLRAALVFLGQPYNFANHVFTLQK
ncbi:hypothetical protein SAMN05428949_3150 [Chitinophaga sp. YR627]|jgi:hypothetical protein|uniref:Uncharacterized protein n=1 Tax=Chitinophaga pinensis (strain ATCC 43595 / DSM 2588 / LMG 13176 / NBRC 15968 / NCIMB 11800 / UQM 2034) TaxID=485918 RepID=A0A979G1E0_CHIPD|nr:hypothetical protein Cpin_1425 [Chitinophaga pinensis DSM 2588]SFN53490.1 hypothetical protein SAMN05428949_3150 [Chitinophaga sp. YR627]